MSSSSCQTVPLSTSTFAAAFPSFTTLSCPSTVLPAIPTTSGAVSSWPTRVVTSPRKRQLRRKMKTLQSSIWKLKKKIQELKCAVKEAKLTAAPSSIEDIVAAAAQYLTPLQLSLFRCQLYNSQKDALGRRYPTDVKLLAIQLQFKSPAAYRFLSEKLFLPCTSTLLNFVENCIGRIHPGLSHNLMKITKLRSDELTSAADRECSLVFDEMSLKTALTYNKTDDKLIGYTENGQVATHALVFMVRGLSSKWKQALGYFLTHNTVAAEQLAQLIASCIAQLSSAGLQVRSVVCDQAATNIAALKRLGFSDQQCWFNLDSSPHPVYVLFDAPHLIKNVRYVRHIRHSAVTCTIYLIPVC